MTHADLVSRAERWLRSKRYNVIATELRHSALETPDAIGFNSGWYSTLIECKTSRSDFLADSKKVFRKNPQYGCGVLRYFMTEPGLISPDELYDKWGLLEVHGRKVVVVKDAEPFTEHIHQIVSHDRQVLYSIARRAIASGFRLECNHDA